MISPVSRADMVKLFEAGVASQAAPNVLGGKTEILDLKPDVVTLEQGTGAVLTIALLPMNSGDTALMTLETLPTPALDTNVRVYTRNWTPLSGLYEEPSVSDWAMKGHQDEAAETLPFMLAEGRWDAEKRTLTFTPTIERWVDEDSKAKVASMIRKSLALKWNGRKFVIKK